MMRFFIQSAIAVLVILVFPLPFKDSQVPVRAMVVSETKPVKASDGLYESEWRTFIPSQTVRNMEPEDAPQDLAEEVRSVLVVGDSLSIPLGQRLEEHFGSLKNIHFKRLGKVSSGLASPWFFNWEENLTSLAKRMKPDMVVIMIGTNDNKNLKTKPGRLALFGGHDWEREYARRMRRLVDICMESNREARIFWVGAPIMGDKDLARDVKLINKVIRDACAGDPNCYYVDTWDALADASGRYTSHVLDPSGGKVRIRASDGVHLSGSGSKILARRCLSVITRHVGFKPSG